MQSAGSKVEAEEKCATLDFHINSRPFSPRPPIRLASNSVDDLGRPIFHPIPPHPTSQVLMSQLSVLDDLILKGVCKKRADLFMCCVNEASQIEGK